MSYANFHLGQYKSITSVPTKRAVKLFEQVNYGIEERKILRFQLDRTESVRRKFSPYWKHVGMFNAQHSYESDILCPGWKDRNDDCGDEWLSEIINQRIAMTKSEEFRLCVDAERTNHVDFEYERKKARQLVEFNEANTRSEAAAAEKYELAQAKQRRINNANAQVRVDAYNRRKKKSERARYVSFDALLSNAKNDL